MTDLQTVLQIPSLLLLPGLLVVISFFAVWNSGRSAATGSDVLSRVAFAWSPWLWIVAITTSGFIVFVYPYLTSYFGNVRRDILYGYSLKDLVWVWIGSIVAGVGAALIVILISLCVAQFRGKRRFKLAEEPLDFLKRLTRINRTSRFAFVKIDEHRLYRLDPTEPGPTVWAAPAIRFTPSDLSFDATKVSNAIQADKLKELIGTLGNYTGTGLITLYWDNFGRIVGPSRVPIDIFSDLDLQSVASILQETPPTN